MRLENQMSIDYMSLFFIAAKRENLPLLKPEDSF